MPNHKNPEDLEITLLLDAIYQHCGFDFRDYAQPSLKRLIVQAMQGEKVKSISGLQEAIFHKPGTLRRLLNTLSINVTSMFRDPTFYMAFRKNVVPLIRDMPFVRFWHVGCASGEEVYSMAILLNEERLYEKCRLYATDMNEAVLKEGGAGIYPLNKMREYTKNYQKAGGAADFSRYYTAKYDNACFRPDLQKNIIWAQHNLTTDSSFNEFHVILCRNVMIYFNPSLQTRVHNLIYESLAIGGILGLGDKESLKFTPHDAKYDIIDQREKLYRRRE